MNLSFSVMQCFLSAIDDSRPSAHPTSDRIDGVLKSFSVPSLDGTENALTVHLRCSNYFSGPLMQLVFAVRQKGVGLFVGQLATNDCFAADFATICGFL